MAVHQIGVSFVRLLENSESIDILNICTHLHLSSNKKHDQTIIKINKYSHLPKHLSHLGHSIICLHLIHCFNVSTRKSPHTNLSPNLLQCVISSDNLQLFINMNEWCTFMSLCVAPSMQWLCSGVCDTWMHN